YRDGDQASTLFIRTTITELAGRDRDNYARSQLERDQARKLKQSAAALIAMPVTDQQLDLGYRDFIYELWRFATRYPKVKAAALTAFGASEPDQKIFLASGLLAAKRQDQQDAIDADRQKTEAEKARQKARNARPKTAGSPARSRRRPRTASCGRGWSPPPTRRSPVRTTPSRRSSRTVSTPSRSSRSRRPPLASRASTSRAPQATPTSGRATRAPTARLSSTRPRGR